MPSPDHPRQVVRATMTSTRRHRRFSKRSDVRSTASLRFLWGSVFPDAWTAPPCCSPKSPLNVAGHRCGQALDRPDLVLLNDADAAAVAEQRPRGCRW
ncbi:MAG: hypothetical protein CM15mP18_0080 [Methanobacteriota archaeon]|nr:MAG: hypothetical protein CM15mP18_0080 [Euryarchaeota archaeon]